MAFVAVEALVGLRIDSVSLLADAGHNLSDVLGLVLAWGAIVVALAIVVELSFFPPWWLHVFLWVPLSTVAIVWSLRVAKGWLLAAEYRHAAGEGRLVQ